MYYLGQCKEARRRGRDKSSPARGQVLPSLRGVCWRGSELAIDVLVSVIGSGWWRLGFPSKGGRYSVKVD